MESEPAQASLSTGGRGGEGRGCDVDSSMMARDGRKGSEGGEKGGGTLSLEEMTPALEIEPYFSPRIKTLAQLRISCSPKSTLAPLSSCHSPVTVTRPCPQTWPTRYSRMASTDMLPPPTLRPTLPPPPLTTPHPQTSRSMSTTLSMSPTRATSLCR